MSDPTPSSWSRFLARRQAERASTVSATLDPSLPPGPAARSLGAGTTSWPPAPDPGFETFVTSADPGELSARIVLLGELDAASAPSLAAVLQGAADHGFRHLDLDLRELSFIDAAGLGAIVRASVLLRAIDGELTVRAPSPTTRRIFGISGLAGLLEPMETTTMSGAYASRAPGAGTVAADAMATGLSVPMSSLPPTHAVVDGALRLVVALARATVVGADGVSVSLRRDGRLATVAATDQTILDMDAGQYATGQGPCVDASVKGERFVTEALATEHRWPEFVPKARALGINAILSSPLRASGRPIGALNIYARSADAFASEDQELASLFADHASIILTEAGLDATAEEAAVRFHGALRDREVISQAQGVLMERTGVDEFEAFTLLRRSSVESGTALHVRASGVVDSTRPPPERPRVPEDEELT